MHIKILTTVLTDKSKDYDVVIRSDSSQMQIACYSKNDAEAFVAGLTNLIEAHTCELIEA